MNRQNHLFETHVLRPPEVKFRVVFVTKKKKNPERLIIEVPVAKKCLRFYLRKKLCLKKSTVIVCKFGPHVYI